LNLGRYTRDPKKSNKKPMVETITTKTKREGQRKGQPHEPKKGEI
jgi:hypothetical protein